MALSAYTWFDTNVQETSHSLMNFKKESSYFIDFRRALRWISERELSLLVNEY
jgi:hypothetical protein